MPIDLKKLEPSGLRNLLENSLRIKNADMAAAVVGELHSRGLATSRDYAAFQWNPDRVDKVMQPFAAVAAKVTNNQRVNYTRAGGRKIGRPKDDPEHLWVDSYSAIKIGTINARFSCQIKSPGEFPIFTLYLGTEPTAFYNADQLGQALIELEAIAHSVAPT